MRIIDHCDIYIFIAGCYTPFCLSTIGGTTGWVIFGINWGCAIIGVLLNSINLEKYFDIFQSILCDTNYVYDRLYKEKIH
jgi:channel protein (hemolysin III family)